ncbi:MAG: ABC transporter permease [Cyclobacteriaceae bacterium]|nr:ABC transporter permease [Cyclobacteriaceae bacterium]
MEHHNPGLRLLRRLCPDNLFEGIEGDLVEQYQKDTIKRGTAWAKWQLTLNAMRFIRPGIISRNKFNTNSNTTVMWKNYLKVGWRNILRNGFYSSINVAGLALGLGFSYLTFLYVVGEHNYDRFHSKTAQIVRVVESTVQVETGQQKNSSSVTAIPLGPLLQQDFPEIESFTRFGSWSTSIKIGDDVFKETVTVADETFFRIFDFNVLQGSDKLFVNPSEVVLSEESSHTFFGNEDPVGQDLLIEMGDTLKLFTVAAVVDNHDGESSQHFDVIIPFENFKRIVGEEVYSSQNYGLVETFLLLSDNSQRSFLQEKINDSFLTKSKEKNDPNALVAYLQPLREMRLDDARPAGISTVGNPTYVYVLTCVGALILFMACVNFVSLTSGHTFSRMKEVGVRKVMGAIRGQIRNQLMMEALLLCLVGAVVGLTSVYFIIPLFNLLINSTVHFSFETIPVLFIIALILIIVIVAGGIPSRLLVMLQPAQALKNKAGNNGRGNAMHVFVVIQFTLSLALIIGTFVMNRQMNYIYEKNLGFDKERLFQVSLNNPASKNEAARLVNLYQSQASNSSRLMAVAAQMNDYEEPWTRLSFMQEAGDPEELYFNMVDPNYLSAMGLEVVAGKWFDKNQKTEGSKQIVVNEALVKHFQWDDPLAHQIPGKNFESQHEIIGVVKDYHFSSLHNKIEPLILALDQDAISEGVTGLTTYRWPPMYNSLAVKISPGEIQPALKEIESIWREVKGDSPFEGAFVDQSLDAQYANEQRWKRIINYSSLFAYTIATLGLIGLVRLLLQRKMKEIGIRRVLGSDFGNLLLHFSKGFVTLVVVAVLLAWPAAWWAGEQWLQSFTYRVTLSPLPFVVGTLTVCLGIFFVVGILTWIAAQTRPVEVLKNE